MTLLQGWGCLPELGQQIARQIIGPLSDGYVAVWERNPGRLYYADAFADTQTMSFLVCRPAPPVVCHRCEAAEAQSFVETNVI